jgi:SAM-dependent methyltransferase
MKIVDFLRRLRGKITGLNAISARFDTLQMQLDRLFAIAEQLKRREGTLPSFENNLPNVQNGSPTASISHAGASLDSSTDLSVQVVLKQKEVLLVEALPSEKIRLVFFVIFPELWPSIEAVWKRATKDERFVVSVVVVKSTNPDMTLISLSKAQELLEIKGISSFTEQSFSLGSYRPHVVFYPSPYASHYPQSYKPEVVAAMGCRIAYVSYGLEVGGGMFNARYQYDSDVPRVAWRVFARSWSQLASFGHHCSYGNGHVVVTGHPRAEMAGSGETHAHRVASAKARGRLVTLWTPHFSVMTRRKWSSFLDHHETILRLIDDRPDLFLLVRPHPFLRTSLAKLEGWGAERVAAWFCAINEKDNVHVDTESDYRPAFETSSALIADAGSFLVEYLRTGKPVCHLTGKDDIGLNEEVRSLACFYAGATEIDISGFLDRVSNGDDPLCEARKSALQAYFGTDNKIPSQSILDEIANNISNPSPRIHSSALPTSPLHDEAFQYWVKATSTFLAPETYYQEQENKLRDILGRHAKGRFAADIGCGNGRFTQIISEHFEFTEATDPNELLISEAREQAVQKSITNIAYYVERLEHAESLSSYDFVSCMGVTSGLVDDDVFIKSIWKLKAAMRPGAILLMKDTVTSNTAEAVGWNGYTAVYRNVSAYLEAFSEAGLNLIEQQILANDENRKRINGFFVFMAA